MRILKYELYNILSNHKMNLRFVLLMLLLQSVYSQQCSCEEACADSFREKIGRATWFLIHEVVEKVSYSMEAEESFKDFILSLENIYPCGVCRSHISKLNISRDTIKMSSEWACNFHNKVNFQLGKPLVKCV